MYKSHELLGLLTQAVFSSATEGVRAGEESDCTPEADIGVEAFRPKSLRPLVPACMSWHG